MISRPETSILKEALVEVSSLPETLVYRNNTGQAWQGKPVDVKVGQTIVVRPGMKILADARPIKFGLEGSGDIMGASRGIPVAIETKTARGAQREAQKLFEMAWVKAGGLYVLARSAADAVTGILMR